VSKNEVREILGMVAKAKAKLMKSKGLLVDVRPDLREDIQILVEQIFKKIDQNKDNQLSEEEFRDGLTKYPELCSIFQLLL
jgi:hypothetical protein